MSLQVFLANPHRAFYVGQPVDGYVLLSLQKPAKRCKSVEVEFVAEANINLDARSNELARSLGKHTAKLLDRRRILMLWPTASSPASSSTPAGVLPEGQHKFPFRFETTDLTRMPASFSGTFGSVAYSIRASFKRTMTTTKKAWAPFTMVPVTDVNNPAYSHPQQGNVHKKFGWKLSPGGSIEVNASLPRAAFFCNDMIPVTVDVANNSKNKSVSKVELRLIQTVTYKWVSSKKVEENILARVESSVPAINSSTRSTLPCQIQLPICAPTTECTYLQTAYSVRIFLNPNDINMKLEIPFVVASIRYDPAQMMAPQGVGMMQPPQMFPQGVPAMPQQAPPPQGYAMPPPMMGVQPQPPVIQQPMMPPPTYGGVPLPPTYEVAPPSYAVALEDIAGTMRGADLSATAIKHGSYQPAVPQSSSMASAPPMPQQADQPQYGITSSQMGQYPPPPQSQSYPAPPMPAYGGQPAGVDASGNGAPVYTYGLPPSQPLDQPRHSSGSDSCGSPPVGGAASASSTPPPGAGSSSSSTPAAVPSAPRSELSVSSTASSPQIQPAMGGSSMAPAPYPAADEGYQPQPPMSVVVN